MTYYWKRKCYCYWEIYGKILHADVDADMTRWFWCLTRQELYCPKQKSVGPIIVFKFLVGVCRPNHITLTVRFTSTSSYAKGLLSLWPVHLHVSFILLNRGPNRLHPPRPFVSLYPPRSCNGPQAGTSTRKH